MYSLLLDSSNKNLSVGLARDHKMVDEISYEAWQEQSELLVAEIDKMLKKHDVKRADLGEVVVSKGPGSYTGVRIALTVAKTISFALSIPLFLVSSLEVLKVPSRPTICLVNARSKRSYIGVYDGEKCLLADTIMDNEEVKNYCKSHPDYAIAGEVDYLGLPNNLVDVVGNLLSADTERNLVKEPLAAKPVYLKDSYPV
jgi:tRNA threonylcarbamoyladenosine biosynthesis protein TsaB